MMHRHQKGNFLEIIACLSLLISLNRASFLIETATGSSLIDREARIVSGPNFDLARTDRKLPSEEITSAIKNVMTIVEENLVAELFNKNTKPDQLKNIGKDKIKCSSTFRHEQGSKGSAVTNNSPFYTMDGMPKADIYASLSCSFAHESDVWTFKSDLFDQGGENAANRENYNLMITIEVAEQAGKNFKSKTYFEEQHLLATNIGRDGYDSLLKQEIADIVNKMNSSDPKDNPTSKKSLAEIYTVLEGEVKTILFGPAQPEESVQPTESVVQATESNFITNSFATNDLLQDSINIKLYNDVGSYATFKAEIGSLVFTMVIPRRGWIIEAQKKIVETFKEKFGEWWKKAKDTYKQTKEQETIVHENHKYLYLVKDFIMSAFKNVNGENKSDCYYPLPNDPSEKPEESSYYRFFSIENPTPGLYQTLVIHLKNNGKNIESGHCAHNKNEHKSADYISIYFHHFKSGSLNYGHLFIDSETQNAESLIDLSKDIEEQIKKQVVDFLNFDQYADLERMKGHSFNVNDILKLLAYKKLNSKLKCFVSKSDFDKAYEDFVSKDVQEPFKGIINDKTILACAKRDAEPNKEGAPSAKPENIVMIAKEIKNNDLIDLKLFWPEDFNQSNLKETFAEKYGVDLQFDFPKYNSYDQIDHMIGERVVAFLQLVGDDDKALSDLKTLTFIPKNSPAASKSGSGNPLKPNVAQQKVPNGIEEPSKISPVNNDVVGSPTKKDLTEPKEENSNFIAEIKPDPKNVTPKPTEVLPSGLDPSNIEHRPINNVVDPEQIKNADLEKPNNVVDLEKSNNDVDSEQIKNADLEKPNNVVDLEKSNNVVDPKQIKNADLEKSNNVIDPQQINNVDDLGPSTHVEEEKIQQQKKINPIEEDALKNSLNGEEPPVNLQGRKLMNRLNENSSRSKEKEIFSQKPEQINRFINNETSFGSAPEVISPPSKSFDIQFNYHEPLTTRRYVKKTLNLANDFPLEYRFFSTNNLTEKSNLEAYVGEKLTSNKITSRI